MNSHAVPVLSYGWKFTIALIASISLGFCAVHGEEPRVSRGPYLQLAAPESMVVVWRTNGETDAVVRIGDAPNALHREIDGAAITLRVSADVEAPDEVARLYKEPLEDAARRDPRDADPSTAAGTYQYEAYIDGLQPATRYYYGVYDGERRLAGGDPAHYFETSPPHGSEADLRVWVVGDSGTGDEDQRRVHDAMVEFCQETKRDLDLYLHVGDMAYGDGTDHEFQHHFFAPYQYTLRNTVCWPTMGNHEGHTSRGMSGFGPYYDAYVVPTTAEAGGLPSGSEAYYSFDIANVHFVCLDSHDLDRRPTGAMAQWLVADLEESHGDWLIAFWHHPPYTKGSHDSDRETQLIEMRTHIMPILESGGVDIVLSGHSHIYERSMLIDGAYATPTTAEGVVLDDGDGRADGDGAYRKSRGHNPHEGTVSIVAGHGGAGLSRKGTMPIMREIIIEHGSVILDIHGDMLTGTMVNKNNVQRDVFSIVKQGEVEVTRVAHPWQPDADPSQLTVFFVGWESDKIGTTPVSWTVVQGSTGSMVVEGENDTRRRHALVTAMDDGVIALYDKFDDFINEFECLMEIPADAASSAGLVFGYENSENYYIFRLNAKSRMAELVRAQQGQERMVTRKPIELDFSGAIKVELESLGKILEVQLQDDLEYTINLQETLPAGRLGVYVAPHGLARYHVFDIERGVP